MNKDDATVLDSDERTLEYTTKVVTLSNISVSGSTATWSVTAYKTYLKVGSGNYQETTAPSYVPSSEGTFAIKVKAEGGWDNSNKVFYYASAAIEKSASVTLAKLATPTLTTNSKGVIWSSVSNASTYSVKVDGGNYKNQSDKSVAFSTSTGTHKVYVKAIAAANSGYQDSEAASFTYETKQTSFSFLSSSATRVTWQYSGLKAQYSTNNGSSYTDTTLTGYTASATGSVSFRAVGGWDAAGCVFYNGTTTAQSKSFTLPGLSIANNFEKGVGGWTKQEYKTNAWATNNNIGITPVTDAYGAGTAIKVKTWLNGVSYRIGYQFGDFPTVYKSLSFDVKLADPSEAKTSFTFQDSASGTYVVYSLENLGLTHGVWYHVTIGHYPVGALFDGIDGKVGDVVEVYHVAANVGKCRLFVEKESAAGDMMVEGDGRYSEATIVVDYFGARRINVVKDDIVAKTPTEIVELWLEQPRQVAMGVNMER